MRSYPVLCLGAVLLVFPACGTEEIATPITYAGTEPGPDRGELLIIAAPTADSDEEAQAQASARPVQYGVFVDGRQLAFKSLFDGSPLPVSVGDTGGASGAGYLPAGPHHFAIAAAGGSPVIFAGDAEILPGSMTRLYVFGPAGARQGRFVSYPSVPAPGTLHVSLINLVHLGPGIEVVSCADAAPCAPLSPPLAFGDHFDADFASGGWDGTSYLLASGASIGYRQIATTALPAPPVQPLYSIFDGAPAKTDIAVSANVVCAPIYMSAEGNVRVNF